MHTTNNLEEMALKRAVNAAYIQKVEAKVENGIEKKRKVKREIKKTVTRRRKSNGSRRACKRWTEEQNEQLRKAVERNGQKNWKKIAQELGNVFTADQCNQHWHRVLNPRIKKGVWAKEEVEELFRRVAMYGETSWKKIADGFAGRTDIQCRHRYHTEKRKKEMLRKAIKQLEELKKKQENKIQEPQKEIQQEQQQQQPNKESAIEDYELLLFLSQSAPMEEVEPEQVKDEMDEPWNIPEEQRSGMEQLLTEPKPYALRKRNAKHDFSWALEEEDLEIPKEESSKLSYSKMVTVHLKMEYLHSRRTGIYQIDNPNIVISKKSTIKELEAILLRKMGLEDLGGELLFSFGGKQLQKEMTMQSIIKSYDLDPMDVIELQYREKL